MMPIDPALVLLILWTGLGVYVVRVHSRTRALEARLAVLEGFTVARARADDMPAEPVDRRPGILEEIRGSCTTWKDGACELAECKCERLADRAMEQIARAQAAAGVGPRPVSIDTETGRVS